MSAETIMSIDLIKAQFDAFSNILGGVRGMFLVTTEVTTPTEIIENDVSIFYIMNSDTAQTLTIAADLNNIPIGYAVSILQKGTGSVTIEPDTGVTILKSSSTLTISDRYKTVQLLKTAENEWVAIGSFL